MHYRLSLLHDVGEYFLEKSRTSGLLRRAALWSSPSSGSVSWSSMFGGFWGRKFKQFSSQTVKNVVISSNFQYTSGGKFKYYCFYVVGISIVSIVSIVAFYNNFLVPLLLLLLVIFLCLVCFVFSAGLFYDMTGVDMDFGRKRMDVQEKKWEKFLKYFSFPSTFDFFRFLTYLAFFLTTITVWSVEIFTWEVYKQDESFIVADVLKLLQAIVYFIILVLEREARLIISGKICCC